MEARFADALAAISDDEILEIEKGLVRIPSYTTEEAEIAEFIADLLNGEGIEVGLQRVPFTDIAFSRTKRSYNVIGRLHGSGGGPSLMFNGHMDHGPIGGRELFRHHGIAVENGDVLIAPRPQRGVGMPHKAR